MHLRPIWSMEAQSRPCDSGVLLACMHHLLITWSYATPAKGGCMLRVLICYSLIVDEISRTLSGIVLKRWWGSREVV